MEKMGEHCCLDIDPSLRRWNHLWLLLKTFFVCKLKQIQFPVLIKTSGELRATNIESVGTASQANSNSVVTL